MRKSFKIVLILFAVIVIVSCSDTESYADMLDDEKKVIEQLIDDNDFEILKKFPEDSVFEDNQFVKLDSGVYLNIVDKGSDDRAVLYSTKMLYRCTLTYPMDSTYDAVYGIANYGPHSNGTYPLSFYYGESASSSNIYVGEGMQEALEYVGDRAKVKLIVPFKRGTYYDQTYGEPAYYEILEYIFVENL